MEKGIKLEQNSEMCKLCNYRKAHRLKFDIRERSLPGIAD